jgi:hypothetical protein
MNPLDHNFHLGARHGSWPDARDGRVAVEVRDHGEVKDWKKGCVVAAKVCVMIRVSSLLWS